MADIIPINTWFCFDFVSSVHRGPFNNVQLSVYIITIKNVLYTQLSQLSHISQEILKHNNIAMCCHTIYTGKKCLFNIIAQKMRSWKNTTSTSPTCAKSFISINDSNIIINRFQQLFTFIHLSFKSMHLSSLAEVNLYHYMHVIIYHSIAWCWVLIKQNTMLISHESNSCRVTVMQPATASMRTWWRIPKTY
jgi:hypothetical protein